MLTKAIQIATEAHKGQVDKGGYDYIEHPLRVMNCVKGHDKDDIENTQIVAVLHDIVEDTDTTIADLQREGFNDEVVEGVRCMTRGKTETWNSYIVGIMGNKIAIRVKICDLRDNLNLARLQNIKDIDFNSLNMYLNTYHKLIKYGRENGLL